MNAAKLVNIYLSQTQHYHSDRAGAMILIEDMAPAHAANAARNMLNMATNWAVDAERTTIKSTSCWMVNQPLWKALIQRAQS
jgi:hypothetical protein